MERVVGRAELYADEENTSGSETPDVEALQRFKNSNSIDLRTGDSAKGSREPQNEALAQVPEEDEEELEFRLFAPAPTTTARTKDDSTPATATTKKIRLRSPSLDTSNPGFIVPHRDSSYYFANPAPLDDPTYFSSSAFSGEQISDMSRSYWPGSTYEWRCLHLPRSAEARSIRSKPGAPITGFGRLLGVEGGDEEVNKRRTRLGKKSRLKVRMRIAATKAKAEKKRKGEEEKEEAEREKRNKRNREKKIKRRARERAKKAEAAGRQDGAIDDGDGRGSDSEDS